MVEKEVTLKILADVDDSQVEDLENVLQQIVDGKITIPVETDSTELEEVESRIEELEQKRADIYMGMDDTELEEVEAELDELEARQIELTATVDSSGINETSQDLDNLEQSADNASSALESMAMIDIAGSLSQWGSQAESFAQELDNIAISSEQLAIQTGMTDAEMTGMLNNITNATFPRDEALMYVQSLDQIGVSAQNLGASATGLDRINDAFHMGAPAVNKLGQELSVLGVDMNNVSSSFNALAYANANTVGGMENFSKFLTRYDSQFHELGMNVDQAAVAIAAATHKFGGGRAALTGMSEALKNANGDLSVLEQELGLTAGSLSNASQLTGQYAGQLDAMADKEGEHKTLTQQLAAALDDVTASLTGTISPFASFIGMIGNAGSFAVGINAMVQLTQTIREAEIAQAALNLEVLMNPYVWIAVAIIALVAALWYLYNTNEAVRQAFDHVGEALGRLWEKLSTALQPAIDAIIQAWNGFMEALGLSEGDILDGVIFFIVAFAEGLVAIIDGITWLVEGITWLWEMVSGAFNGMGMDGMTWLSIILMVLSGPIGAILFLITHFEQLRTGIFNALEGARQVVVTKLEEIKQWFYSKIQFIADTVRDGANRIYHFFIDPITRIKEKVGEELAAVKATVMSYIQPLIDAFNALGSAASWAFSFLGLGQRSPGDIYKSMKRELEWTTSFVEDDKPGLVSATANLGRDIVSGFNPRIGQGLSFDVNGFEANKQGTQSTGANSNGRQIVNNLTFNLYGDMDTEERMKKFLDYVTEYLDWDNNTAGRNMEVL